MDAISTEGEINVKLDGAKQNWRRKERIKRKWGRKSAINDS